MRDLVNDQFVNVTKLLRTIYLMQKVNGIFSITLDGDNLIQALIAKDINQEAEMVLWDKKNLQRYKIEKLVSIKSEFFQRLFAYINYYE